MSTDRIVLTDAPPIESLVFRHLRGVEDADGIYALRVACADRDQVDHLAVSENVPTRDEIREAYAGLVTAGLTDRRLLAEIGGQVAGYTLVDPWHEADGRWVYLILGWVIPDWRDRGIGTAMLLWGEATARRLAAADHPGEPFEFAANASSTQPDATALLLNEGYYVGYTVLGMAHDAAVRPPVHPLPPGIEVRPARPEHFPLIAAGMQEAYHDEYPGGRFLETETLEEAIAGLSAARHNPELWQIAWDGDEVAGQVIPVFERGRVFMYDISVRPGWRRRGVARALLTRALEDLYARGYEVIRLNTVAEFPTQAWRLYESVGFRVVKEYPRYRKSPE